ncbi:MAG: FAD-dependent oxidoreductase, partial [Myxococcota bacterium]
VVVIGGGLVGVELAEFLAERGRRVAVAHEGPVMALEMAHPRRWRVLHDLREMGVELYTRTTVREITEECVHAERAGKQDAAPEALSLPADTVIVATGLAPNPGPVDELRRAGAPVVVVGDAGGVGYIEGAIHQGFAAVVDL